MSDEKNHEVENRFLHELKYIFLLSDKIFFPYLLNTKKGYLVTYF